LLPSLDLAQRQRERRGQREPRALAVLVVPAVLYRNANRIHLFGML